MLGENWIIGNALESSLLAIVWICGVDGGSIKDRANNFGTQHARGLVVSKGISNTHL